MKFNLIVILIFLSLLSCVNSKRTDSTQKLINTPSSIVNGDYIKVNDFDIYFPDDKTISDSLTISISFQSAIDSISKRMVDSVKIERSTFLFIQEFDQLLGIPKLEEIDESTYQIYVLDGSGSYDVKFRPKICGNIELLLLINDQLQYPLIDNNIRWIQDIATITKSTSLNCDAK